jgi:hypothetical protein
MGSVGAAGRGHRVAARGVEQPGVPAAADPGDDRGEDRSDRPGPVGRVVLVEGDDDDAVSADIAAQAVEVQLQPAVEPLEPAARVCVGSEAVRVGVMGPDAPVRNPRCLR